MSKTRTLRPRLFKKQGVCYKAFLDPSVEEILYGGGARGGKTRGICEIINLTCWQYPGIRRLVGRREWDDIQKTTLRTLYETFKDHKLIEKVHRKMNLQTKILTFKNGSEIFFVPLKKQPSDPEFNWLGGYEITHAFVDEAQEVERKAINIIKSRLTHKIKEYDLIGKTLMGCNPMKGHLYKDFIKPRMKGTLKKTRRFIQSLYTDNPYIDHAKYKNSLADADKVTKERLLKGNREYDNTPGRLYAYDDLCDLFTNPRFNGEKYIICDAARKGADRAVITVWNGFEIIEMVVYDKCLNTDLENKIMQLCQKYSISMSHVLIDEIGVGGGIVDTLRCKGFVSSASPIQDKLGFETTEKPNYVNLRAQCFFKLQQNITKIRICETKFEEEIIEELDVMAEVDLDKDTKRKVISKKDIKEQLGRSPDFADTIMMRQFFELKEKQGFEAVVIDR